MEVEWFGEIRKWESAGNKVRRNSRRRSVLSGQTSPPSLLLPADSDLLPSPDAISSAILSNSLLSLKQLVPPDEEFSLT